MMEDAKNEIGSVIRRFRYASGLTQGQLADAAGLSVGLLRDLEQGRTQSPRWGSVEALARALGLGTDERAHFAAAWERGTAARRSQPGGAVNGSSDRVHAVTVRLLGPLAADQVGSKIDLGSARRKAVLALIALRGEAGARLSELTSLLWPDCAPARASRIIQQHVSKLRQVLYAAPGHRSARQLIVWSGMSYRLQPGLHCRLDSAIFDEFVKCADRAVADGAPDHGCKFYERALHLWCGRAVADLDCLEEHPLAVALNQQRAEVTVRYADAAALAGDHGRSLLLLREACQAERLNEVLHARLIDALGHTGRRAEAVRVFQQLRDRLGDELCIAPSDLVWRAYRLVIEARDPLRDTAVALPCPARTMSR